MALSQSASLKWITALQQQESKVFVYFVSNYFKSYNFYWLFQIQAKLEVTILMSKAFFWAFIFSKNFVTFAGECRAWIEQKANKARIWAKVMLSLMSQYLLEKKLLRSTKNFPKNLPPSQGSGLDEALAQANPAGHCVQFKWAPPREYIPAGHGIIAKLKNENKCPCYSCLYNWNLRFE